MPRSADDVSEWSLFHDVCKTSVQLCEPGVYTSVTYEGRRSLHTVFHSFDTV